MSSGKDDDSKGASFDATLHTPSGHHSGAVRTKFEDEEAYCSACNQSFPIDQQVCPNDGARLVKLKASRDPLIGRVFEQRYEIRTTLGEGGMGTVYRGWQLSVDREVAIKVVHPSIASDRTAVKRFLREARLSSRLSQPNIVNVYDFGQTEDGILYLVMELLRGNTLAHELESQRPMALRRVLTIGLQLCDALQAAHAMGIVHRDLKPGNVVILADPPGRDLIKVLDFGLAKSLVTDSTSNVTNTNAILGTPLYMAPEQIEGKPTDQRADIYAMGCMLHQMLTGRPPYLAENANLVLAAHINDPIPKLPANVPVTLVNVIEQMMAKRIEARLASAQQVRAVLESIVDAGYGAPDLADTTPDIPLEFKHSIALANTAEHTNVAPIKTPGQTTEITPRSRLLPILVAIAVIAVAAVIIVLVLDKRTAAVTPADAAAVQPMSIDARSLPAVDALTVTPDAPSIDAGVADAAIPVDARSSSRPRGDAGVRPPRVDAAVPQVAPVDAGLKFAPKPDAEPTIEFLKVKKGSAN